MKKTHPYRTPLLFPSYLGKEGTWRLLHLWMWSSEEKSKKRLQGDGEVDRTDWEGKSLPERDRDVRLSNQKIIASVLLPSDFLIYEVIKLRALSIFQDLDPSF